MKKVLFIFSLIFATAAMANDEAKFNACLNKYRNIPEAMKQWVLENKITVDIPKDAHDLITKEIKYLIVPDPARPENVSVYASMSPVDALKYKVAQCMNEVDI